MSRLLLALMGNKNAPMKTQNREDRVKIAHVCLERLRNGTAGNPEWRYIVNIINLINVVDEFKKDPKVEYKLDSSITEEHEAALKAIVAMGKRSPPRFEGNEEAAIRTMIDFFDDICASGPERLIVMAEGYVNQQWEKIDKQMHGERKATKRRKK